MRNIIKHSKNYLVLTFTVVSMLSSIFILTSSTSALSLHNINNDSKIFAITQCGSGHDGTKYTPSIELGCSGKGNPIMDVTFGIIKFLSDGAGLVIVASLVWAGILYIISSGDPQSTANAVKRIRSNVVALLIFIFAYAILNYLVPGAILQ